MEHKLSPMVLNRYSVDAIVFFLHDNHSVFNKLIMNKKMKFLLPSFSILTTKGTQ